MGAQPLDFVTTACCRPKVFNSTLKSFTGRMLDVKFKQSTLYLNVDPIPENRNPLAVVEVAKKFFGNVVYNIPEKPNFTTALKWGFQQPEGRYFFYLQDDWALLKTVRVSELRKMMGSSVVVNKYTKERGKVINVVLRAYGSISDHRICLSPSLMDTAWAKEYSLLLDENLNPERQFRPVSQTNKGGGQASSKQNVGQQYPANPRHGIIVKDLGRPWLKQNKLKRNATKWKFNTWVPKGYKYKKRKSPPKDE